MAPEKFSSVKLKTVSKLASSLLALDPKSSQEDCIKVLSQKLEQILSKVDLPAAKKQEI